MYVRAEIRVGYILYPHEDGAVKSLHMCGGGDHDASGKLFY